MGLYNFREKIRTLPLKTRVFLGVLGIGVLGGMFYSFSDKSNFFPQKNEIREEYGGYTFPPGVPLRFPKGELENKKLNKGELEDIVNGKNYEEFKGN